MRQFAHIAQTARALWREIGEDEVADWAAALSYRFLLALFPFLIFLGAVGGIVASLIGADNPAIEVLSRFGGALPSDARSLLETQLDAVLGEPQPGLLSIGLVGAIWAASSGLSSTMKAMNHAYDVEETRPFWKRTALSVGLTVLTGLVFIAASILAVAGQALGSAIADGIGLGDGLRAALLAGQLAVAVVLLTSAVAFLYWAAPNTTLRFRWITPGAVMFVVTWIAGSLVFGWYVSNLGSYNATYGAVGGVVVLMVWFYLTALMLLAGAELNALLAQQQAPETSEVLAAQPKVRRVALDGNQPMEAQAEERARHSA